MKIVIEIDEDIYNDVKTDNCFNGYDVCEVKNAIKNGIPLEEELEKIKSKINLEDVDCQYEEDYMYSSGLQKAIDIIDNHIAELKGE